MKPKVTLHFSSTLNHNNQIYCGLEILKRQGFIELDYRYDYKKLPINLTLVEVDGLKMILDTDDNAGFFHKQHYDNCDFFVKRMLSHEDAAQFSKMRPFGLNYPVFSNNHYMRSVFLKDRSHLLFSMRYSRLFSWLLNINESVYNCDYKNFGNAANDNGKVLFSARLWNPDRGNTDGKKTERHEMNNERIAIIRNLTELYGDRFFGGIQDDELSQTICPDIILDKKLTDKKHYLKEIKNFSIGICSKGLEDSVGWKFGEYISNSLAVVSNPIDMYVHHGNLEKNTHFLEYNSIEECLAQVETLLNDTALRKQISENNKKYYDDYLHPAAKLREIFRLIGIPLDTKKSNT